MGFATFLPTPVTDFLLYVTPKSLPANNKNCMNIFLKFGDCLEAYGIYKGKEKCADLFYDLCECRSQTLQKERYKVIQNERMKQYQEGKLKTPFEENPPPESYYYD